MNEEDIKNLSEIIELCKEEINNNDENVTAILDLTDLKSLRNLITRNRELEALKNSCPAIPTTGIECDLKKQLEENQIIINKKIRNGKPVIANTRLTIIDVLCLMTEFIKRHEEEFRKNYADISINQIISAIDYFIDNSIQKSKVEETIEELKQEYKIELEKNSIKAFILKCKIEALEELLQEGENNA